MIMQELIISINKLSMQRSGMKNPSPEFDAVTSVLEACNAIRWSLQSPSGKPTWMLQLMGKPTPQESYKQVMDVLANLNGALDIFNKKGHKTPQDKATFDQHIREIGDISQTLLGHPNKRLQGVGVAIALAGVILILIGLLAAPATFGLSLIIPVAVVVWGQVSLGAAMAAGGVYTGVNNLRETGLAKAVSDLTELDSMKPKS
jgi:hypothetical protein